jgi:hypothetical protein
VSDGVDHGAASESGAVIGGMLPFEWAVASRSLEGMSACGDRSLVLMKQERALVAAVDGLGHGQEAARAAEQAVRVLVENADDGLVLLFERCHQALRDTRGVVMSVGVVDPRSDTLTWAGVGDVEGVLLRGRESDARDYLLRRAGVVGGWDKLRTRPQTLTLRPGDTLIFATDGIRGGFESGLVLRDEPSQIAEQILAENASALDDSLVFVGRYLGGGADRSPRRARAAARPEEPIRLEPAWGR